MLEAPKKPHFITNNQSVRNSSFNLPNQDDDLVSPGASELFRFDVQPLPGDEREPSVAIRQAGLRRLEAGAFAEAIELLGRAVALNPKDPHTQLGLGMALQRAGLHADALAPLEQAQKSLPQDPAPFLYASLSQLALGKPEAALKASSEACVRGPRLPQAHLAHGRALMALDEPARAEQAFTASLQLAPQWAEAWAACGAARRRQGAIEGARAALSEALRLAPAHGAARANLAALQLPKANAEEAFSAPVDRSDSDRDGQRTVDKAAFSAWRPKSATAAVGLAVEYLSKKPAFATLPFGEWSQVLFYQAARGHYFFVVDQNRRIRGFLGWALTDGRRAELWLEGLSGLSNSDCLKGDCVIVNAWSADGAGVSAFIREAMRKLFADRRAVYFKRHYPDGRERPMRLSVPASRARPFGTK